ncbi:hypothetical protein, partial [Desulfovibrio sp.]|uniref:hypothetical protein n=1 Tax=Desulfovibrio sp. TaxID=885 RepID=UPI0023BBF630
MSQDHQERRESTPQDSGLRLALVNGFILLLTLAFFVFLIHTTVHVAEEYKASTDAMENYIAWENSGQRVRRGSDYLT